MSTGVVQMAGVVAALAAAVAVLAWFEMVCLADLARTPDAALRGLTRAGWLAVIVVSIPLGGVAYLLYGRAR